MKRGFVAEWEFTRMNKVITKMNVIFFLRGFVGFFCDFVLSFRQYVLIVLLFVIFRKEVGSPPITLEGIH